MRRIIITGAAAITLAVAALACTDGIPRDVQQSLKDNAVQAYESGLRGAEGQGVTGDRAHHFACYSANRSVKNEASGYGYRRQMTRQEIHTARLKALRQVGCYTDTDQLPPVY